MHSGHRIDGRSDHGALVMDAPLGRTPILVRGGAVLTLGNVRQSTAEPVTELTLDCYPDADTPGTWTLIEDAGDGFGYLSGELAETTVTVSALAADAGIEIAARQGHYQPRTRDLLLRLHLPEPPAQVRLDGRPTDNWHWNAERQAVELRIADDARAHRMAAFGS
jgi:alpha-glucosidase